VGAADEFAEVAVEVRLVGVAALVGDVCQWSSFAHALSGVFDADQAGERLRRQPCRFPEAGGEMPAAPAYFGGDGLDRGRSAGGS
jgi:hypothetical protein